MLPDPFVVKSLSIGANTAITVVDTNSFVTIDAGAGRSIRKCSTFQHTSLSMVTPSVLTLGHSTSNDNKPAITDRHACRLDFALSDKEGLPLNSYGFAVIGVPRGAYDITNSAFITPSVLSYAIASALIGALAVNPASAALSATRLAAFLAGEP